MPKYYCDYCKSYLTHDTMSVRKSHLTGKNHIKYYCDYYEQKAKETGIWNPLDSKYEINIDTLNENAPRSRNVVRQRQPEETFDKMDEDSEEETMLPPPPNVESLPQPPPSVLRYTEDYQRAILRYQSLTTN